MIRLLCFESERKSKNLLCTNPIGFSNAVPYQFVGKCTEWSIWMNAYHAICNTMSNQCPIQSKADLRSKTKGVGSRTFKFLLRCTQNYTNHRQWLNTSYLLLLKPDLNVHESRKQHAIILREKEKPSRLTRSWSAPTRSHASTANHYERDDQRKSHTLITDARCVLARVHLIRVLIIDQMSCSFIHHSFIQILHTVSHDIIIYCLF